MYTSKNENIDHFVERPYSKKSEKSENCLYQLIHVQNHHQSSQNVLRGFSVSPWIIPRGISLLYCIFTFNFEKTRNFNIGHELDMQINLYNRLVK